MIHIKEEAARCLLCKDAPCSKACRHGDPARAIRAIRFDNERLMGRWVAECTDEDLEAAEKACIHYDKPIRIKELVRAACDDAITASETVPSLAIDFCGIRCENPFFLASSAVCTNYEMVARAFDAGWAGVFYKTICLQEIREVSPRFDACQQEGSADFYAFRNMEQLSENPVEMDFDILRRLKLNYPSKVVVASIMGQTEEEWIKLAKMAEAAGVDAVELNFSCPQMRMAGMGSDVGQNPELVLFYSAFVKRSVSIPVIPKMTPNITHITEPTMSAFFAGADAISAINTIKSVTMGDRARVSGHKTISGLSGRAVRPIALRHILEMAQTPMTRSGSKLDESKDGMYGKGLEISGIGGIETWRDALEFIQLGCRNVQVCTAVMQYGYRIIDDMILGMQNYLAERGIASLDSIVGEELPNFATPTDLDRDTIIYPKFNKELCIGCGRCEVSCSDGGHQAIVFDNETRQPRLVGTKCVGCHLCRLVCPTGAIGVTKRIIKMARAALLGLLVLLPLTGEAHERILTLDSCRAMALRNNKQMGVARVKQEVNANLRQSARTKYLPQVNAIGGYEWMSKEVSILNNEQKSVLSNMGTSTATSLQSALAPLVSQLPAETQAKLAQDMSQFAGTLNQVGQHVVDGFRTDTRNTIAGAVTVTQPLFMGGAIVAANKMADINEDMAANSLEAKRQTILFNIDHAYWQVVSLHHKQKLAESYVELVKKLKSDVQKMIDKGVATKGDGLSVGVRVNEAEIALMEVKDGLVLAKMLVCQLCGLPVDENITLADEESGEFRVESGEFRVESGEFRVESGEFATAVESAPPSVAAANSSLFTLHSSLNNRPELKLLQNAVDLSRQTTNVLKAGNLPQVLLTGGYAVSNPNIFNGFEKKFGGFWNVGVLVRVPIWNWGDVKYKVRASKGATTMANLELAEARELVELQVNQSSFRVNEAYKKLEMAQANVANADENLRMANLGFKEGTVSHTIVMEAQTAWQLAQSKKIDAEIGVKLSQVELQKALGTLK